MQQSGFVLLLFGFLSTASEAVDLYSLTAHDAVGNVVPLEQYRGKVSLVVNVASQCGYTDINYRGLVQLQHKFGPLGFTVLAFPCNQFGYQEPGTIQEIIRFTENYGVRFPIFNKVDVIGERTSAVYQYLIGSSGSIPKWNFCKYLVDRNGHVIKFFTQDEPFEYISHSISNLLQRNKDL